MITISGGEPLSHSKQPGTGISAIRSGKEKEGVAVSYGYAHAHNGELNWSGQRCYRDVISLRQRGSTRGCDSATIYNYTQVLNRKLTRWGSTRESTQQCEQLLYTELKYCVMCICMYI